MTATVVLVHGAWHGAWCWAPIVERLDAQGVTSVAFDLPGHGDDPGPFTDLYGDAERVSDVLDGLTAPVVLVGHSYGGAVITDVGLHPAVAHLVYVAAFALAEGETVASAAADEAAASGLEPVSPNLGELMVIAADGTSTLPPEAVADLLYNTSDAAAQAWAAGLMGAQPLVNMAQEARAIAWRDRPSTYVVCEQDRAVTPVLQRIFAERCETMAVLDCDHSPFTSAPDALVEILVRIARSF